MNSHFFYISAIQGNKVVAHGSAVCGGARSNQFDVHVHPMPRLSHQHFSPSQQSIDA